uniref:Spindle pole body component n=1 Tax=Kwoniella bestiolae CBS 10118 TaxID=1296100 RepID=A0A1B9FU71_9TREE|nr:hypothetical protein I302_07962 [Kwoniella bestiolae CBS 10118]OCF22315.1 hypothetical protein I302_07962 [Kwoniella bestiolae CBS 10118]
MLAEVLLLLSGHQSSLFVPHSSTLVVSPHLTEYLHPGEITSLNALADLSSKYRKIKSWATETQKKGREAILLESVNSTSRKGKQREIPSTSNEKLPNQYLTTLSSSILNILREYEVQIVEIESKILSLDPELVQDGEGRGYVPLSNLVANFDKWKIPLASLSTLMDELISGDGDGKSMIHVPGKLIDLVESKLRTGNPKLHKIYSDIISSLLHLFLIHLISFMLYGITTTLSSGTINSIGIDVGSDPSSPRYRIYKLNDNLLPSSIDGKTKESILYIGRVSATLKRENRDLPKSLVEGIKDEIMGVKGLDELSGFGEGIQRARAGIGEWLWTHILTGPQIIESIESLSDYFLTRKADDSLSLLAEIDKLRVTKLILSNPNSSSSVIREQDLDLAMLRSSLGTTVENDRYLEKLRWKMDHGPLRAIPTSNTDKNIKSGAEDNENSQSHIHRLFSSTLFGTPLTLTTSITWPLDLFLSPKSLAIYSDIHSYLIALRYTHMKITNTWSILSSKAKADARQQHKHELQRKLDKSCWNLTRQINWLISELLSHFMGIMEVQHRHLLVKLDIQEKTNNYKEGSLGRSTSKSSLRGSTIGRRSSVGPFPSKGKDAGQIQIPKSPLSESHTNWEERTTKSNKAPPTPNKAEKNYLDFLTLRSIHSQHLSFLLEALLLSDASVSSLIKEILDVCRRFASLVERWNGDSIGSEQNTDEFEMIKRIEAVKEIDETLHDQILDLFTILLDSQNPSPSTNNEGDKSSLEVGGGGKSFSRTSKFNHISKMMSRQPSFTGIGSRSKIGGGGTKENTFGSTVVEVGLERHIEQCELAFLCLGGVDGK